MPISTSRQKAKNSSDAQVKVRKAINNELWGPSTALMSEIADLTHNSMAFTEIMSIVWNRLNPSGQYWRHVYKSLVLLDFLIKWGHEKVAQHCRENVFTIETLKDFQNVEATHVYGLNIGEKAKQITSLLSDDERLKNERTRARPSTPTKEEMQLQIALELSRAKREKADEMRKSDDARLQMALEESQKEADRLATTKQGTVSSEQLTQSALDDLLSLGVGELVSGDSDSSSYAPAATLTSSNSFDLLGGDLLSPTNSMTTSTTNSTNGTRKTPENFLGENKNLVNLDNLLGSNAPSTAGGNPFLTSSAPAANPFAAQRRKSPTLNEMRAALDESNEEIHTLDTTEGGSVSCLLTESQFNDLINFGLMDNGGSDSSQQTGSPAYSSAQRNNCPMERDIPQEHTLDLAHIKLYEQLGEGVFAVVKRGKWVQVNGQSVAVAVKILRDISPSVVNDMKVEASHLLKLQHPSLIRLYGIVSEPAMMVSLPADHISNSIYELQVFELCEGGSLLDRLLDKKRPMVPESLLHEYSIRIAEALRFLQSKRFVHRDVAARNVLLVKDEKTVKLADFGLTIALEDTEETYKASEDEKVPYAWCPPEALAHGVFSFASDVWAFGVMLWELYSLGQEPWTGCNLETVLDLLDAGERLKKPIHCSDKIYELMRSCWKSNSYTRIEIEEVIETLESTYPPSVVFAQTDYAVGTTSHSSSDTDSDSNLPWHQQPPPPKAPSKQFADGQTVLEAAKTKAAEARAGKPPTAEVSNSKPVKKPETVAPNQSKDSDDEETPMEHEPWFFGRISAQRANELLSHGQEGQFLVRFAESNGDEVTISRRGISRNNHFKVQNVDGQLKIRDERTFVNMNELITHYTTNPILSSSNRQLYLTGPLPK